MTRVNHLKEYMEQVVKEMIAERKVKPRPFTGLSKEEKEMRLVDGDHDRECWEILEAIDREKWGKYGNSYE